MNNPLGTKTPLRSTSSFGVESRDLTLTAVSVLVGLGLLTLGGIPLSLRVILAAGIVLGGFTYARLRLDNVPIEVFVLRWLRKSTRENRFVKGGGVVVTHKSPPGTATGARSAAEVDDSYSPRMVWLPENLARFIPATNGEVLVLSLSAFLIITLLALVGPGGIEAMQTTLNSLFGGR
jgi:hypothetical protein